MNAPALVDRVGLSRDAPERAPMPVSPRPAASPIELARGYHDLAASFASMGAFVVSEWPKLIGVLDQVDARQRTMADDLQTIRHELESSEAWARRKFADIPHVVEDIAGDVFAEKTGRHAASGAALAAPPVEAIVDKVVLQRLTEEKLAGAERRAARAERTEEQKRRDRRVALLTFAAALAMFVVERVLEPLVMGAAH